MGEITVGRSLVHGLKALGYETIELIGAHKPGTRLLLRRLGLHFRARGEPIGSSGHFLSQADFLFFDTWLVEHLSKRRIVGPRDAHRTLVLESFGISPEMRMPCSRWIEPRRFLTPFAIPYAWGSNTFLGFILGETADAPIPDSEALLARVRMANTKERFGVLYTKQAKHIDDTVRALLARLARICPIYTTISKECGYHPGILPPGVENLGYLPPQQWQALLGRASFLIGIGHPLLGPAPLDALAAGCAYVNPRFVKPWFINDEPALEISSQNPYVESIPPPFVYTVDPSNVSAVEAAVEASLNGAARCKAIDGEAGRALLAALIPFTEAPYIARLRGILETLA